MGYAVITNNGEVLEHSLFSKIRYKSSNIGFKAALKKAKDNVTSYSDVSSLSKIKKLELERQNLIENTKNSKARKQQLMNEIETIQNRISSNKKRVTDIENELSLLKKLEATTINNNIKKEKINNNSQTNT